MTKDLYLKGIGSLDLACGYLEYLRSLNLPPAYECALSGALYFIEKHKEESRKVFAVVLLNREEDDVSFELFSTEDGAMKRFNMHKELYSDDEIEEEIDGYFSLHDSSGNKIVYECFVQETNICT